VDAKTGKTKRRSPVTKNQRYLTLLRVAVHNQVQFRYVLNDIWFASADNMKYVKTTLQKDFIMPLKSNRKVALSENGTRGGRYLAVSTLDLPADTTCEVWLEAVPFPVLLIKQVFTNEDGSTGIRYLVTSDLTLPYDRIAKLFQNGGASRSITNRSSRMRHWRNLRHGPRPRNATTYSPVCVPTSNWSGSRSKPN